MTSPESAPRITTTLEPPDLTIVTVEGAVSAEQIATHIVSYLSNEPTRLVLWDLRRGTLARIGADGMRMFIQAGKPLAHRRVGGRTAIVSAHAVDYGLSRMFQAIAELYHLPFEVNVFRDVESAERWLREESPHPPSREIT